MRKASIVAVGAAFTFFSANSAFAQTTDSPQEAGPPAPSDRFETVLDGASASIDISEKKAEASLSLGGSLVALKEKADGAQQQDGIYWKIGVKVPVGGASDVLDPKNLDLFNDGVKITGGLTWGHYTSNVNNLAGRKFQALKAPAIQACKTSIRLQLDKLEQSKEQLATAEFAQKKQALVSALENCTQDGERRFGESFVRAHLPNSDILIARALYDPFFTIGVKGTVAINDFDYTLPGVFTDMSERRESYGATITAVYYPADAVSAFKAEVEYGDVFDANDETIVCKTIIVDPEEDCKVAVPTAPSKKESLILRGEYRRYIPFSNSDRGIGVAFGGSYDIESNDVGFELPIYYKFAKSAPVIPGIKFGYTRDASKSNDKDEDFTVAIFLKQSFSF